MLPRVPASAAGDTEHRGAPMAAAAGAVLIKEQHIVDAFQRAGATTIDRAVLPEDIGVDEVGIGWRRLRSRVVIRETEADSGRYYLDVEVWQALRRTRRRLMAIIISVIIIVAFILVPLLRAHG
jgi:hypothetical protein